MNWAKLSLSEIFLGRDFPGPSCLWAELSVIHPMNLLEFVIAFKSTVKSKNKILRIGTINLIPTQTLGRNRVLNQEFQINQELYHPSLMISA